ncbi:MAG TPA: biopolymer transporter ExbD [Cyclobacteriaceae bacterium]|jgi:biopolymer transport protein ExbD|nr:biopolymer transporter ExbD [Cytophagales bacterium]HNT50080.1 biopolymer transporter ExbD [Cyclobacteriaceae bacterium]HRE68716.1 biopolymer transporter ExbD [Cyclobacteriaceae bacterium]HRF34879.1 biopolymer transporter ExbD [Cyclobacteriaceae bacterium]
MSKFKKKTEVKQEIPTSSMPDVVFMLLFFFMVTTELRETSIEVKQQIPRAEQLRKLMRKTLVANLYIGEPTKPQYGKEPKIQADDTFIDTKDIVRWVNEKRNELEEFERDQLTVSLKVDQDAKRGIISDVELELRKANARKLLYNTLQEENKLD